MIFLLVPFSQAQAAPVFQAAGTAVDGTGAVSPAWPAHAINDVALLFVESTGGETVTLSTPAGFVAITNSPQATGAGTAGTRITVFWARATSAPMTAPTVADPGDHVVAQILTYRGAITTGNPWDVTGGGVKATASTSVTATEVTTTVGDTLVVVAVSQDIDDDKAAFSGWTNERVDTASKTGTGPGSGNGGGFGVIDFIMTTAGATGNTTATVSSSINAFLTIALKPAAAGAASKLAFAQQPTNTWPSSVITPAVTVLIQDASGNLVTTATDTITIAKGTDPSSGVALLGGTLSVNAVAGVATFNNLDIDTGGTGYTLVASATGLTGATSSSFNITTPAGTFGVNECAASRFGSDLVCTAADVSITGIAVVPGGPTSCIGGETISVDLDVNVNFATPNRWDVGLFLANDGKSPELRPVSGGASSCTVAVLDTPTINPATAFLDLDANGGTDTCGDGNGSIGGGTGSGVQRIYGVPVACQAVDLSGGRLFIPFLTSWDNQSSPTGSTCTSNRNPVPNTKSKCNVPNGTVLADVLKSTVALVILPTITKTDSITTITAGGSSSYTVVITNTTGAPLSNAIFRDPAVANLTVNSLGCSASGSATCPAPANTTIAAMQGGGITIPTMPVSSSVTFTLGATVSSTTLAGTITNTAEVVVSGEATTATDTNNVITNFTVAKSFLPTSIAAGGTSVLTITLQNTNLAAATGVAFTDTYPTDLVNAAVPGITNSCGGTATAGAASLTLSNGTIAAGGSCSISVNVTSAVAGAYVNHTGPVTSTEGFTGASASAALAVSVSNLSTSIKTWQDLNGGEADPGDTIQYTITLRETAGTTATGVSISDAIAASLTGLSISACPVGATCTIVGQNLTASNITVAANSSVTIVFSGTIVGGTSPGATINNCSTISNPLGLGASPCASTVTVSPSGLAGLGNKLLYLYDAAATPAYKLSRVKPASASSATITQGTNLVWALSPALAAPVTISPNVLPLAIIPVQLYLASSAANESRSVQVDVTCSGGGTIYSETKIFDGTAVNNPYLPTTPALVSFNNLTISANHTCNTGQAWNLTVRNTGTGSVIVHPVNGMNNSFISLPSLNVINVDSVNSYNAAYSAVTTPAGGYYGWGKTVYVRAVVSDPFGSFDITSATVTIKNPSGTNVVTAAMSQVADSGTLTKTYEYAYTIPALSPAGNWTAIVTAQEGTENTVLDSGTSTFTVGMATLTVVKMMQTLSDPVHGASNPYNIPGSLVRYTVIVTNTGNGSTDPDSVKITDPIPANLSMVVSGTPPVTFIHNPAATGLTYTYTSLASLTDDVEFSTDGTNFDYAPTANVSDGTDDNVRHLRINPKGAMKGTVGPTVPSLTFTFEARIK
jgi:uncharacterized repeat protein (TIGR01451 family)